MNVKIKDIPGSLVEKYGEYKTQCEYYYQGVERNEAITQQGEVQIGMNRERLAKIIFSKAQRHILDHNEIEFKFKTHCITWNPLVNEAYVIADAILSDLKGLLEVKK